ncbi:hypothetical protein RB195_011880 [Necator americanus]|uniref:Uncharacterized protein n=1 Tax=Necator americanus TaxID=51031 RepID=A0ABR1D5D0_NECAM
MGMSTQRFSRPKYLCHKRLMLSNKRASRAAQQLQDQKFALLQEYRHQHRREGSDRAIHSQLVYLGAALKNTIQKLECEDIGAKVGSYTIFADVVILETSSISQAQLMLAEFVDMWKP